MVQARHLYVANLLSALLKDAVAALPISHSIIPLSLLLSVITEAQCGNEMTVKTLFSKVPFSDMGKRYHFNRLIEEGLIELIESETDLRVRNVLPTAKLVKLFSDFSVSPQLQPRIEHVEPFPSDLPSDMAGKAVSH